jgi:hypothetical protein
VLEPTIYEEVVLLSVEGWHQLRNLYSKTGTIEGAGMADDYSMTDELRRPCGICGKGRLRHVGKVHACFGGYGTYWSPDGERDERVWPRAPHEELAAPDPTPASKEGA